MVSRLLTRATTLARAAARRPTAQAASLHRVAPSVHSSTFSTSASSSTADTPDLLAHYADLSGFHRDLALAAFRGDVPSTYAASNDNDDGAPPLALATFAAGCFWGAWPSCERARSRERGRGHAWEQWSRARVCESARHPSSLTCPRFRFPYVFYIQYDRPAASVRPRSRRRALQRRLHMRPLRPPHVRAGTRTVNEVGQIVHAKKTTQGCCVTMVCFERVTSASGTRASHR
jgi:hypothetical protein